MTFIALGDWGSPGSPQRAVANAMGKWSQQHKAEFIITTGDNFYENGVSSTSDRQWENTWKRVYTHQGISKLQWYVSLGNHDHHRNNGDNQVRGFPRIVFI